MVIAINNGFSWSPEAFQKLIIISPYCFSLGYTSSENSALSDHLNWVEYFFQSISVYTLMVIDSIL